MKFALSLVALASPAFAHTIFTTLWVNGVSQGALNGVRYPSYDGPVTDVTSNSIICNGDPNPLITPFSKTVIDVPAGATIQHEWHHTLTSQFGSDNADPIDPGHLGPVIVYLAKVPDATQTSVTGLGWFKIAEWGLENGVWGVTQLWNLKGKFPAVIPSCIPSGNYFLRAEIIALHPASTYPGAQFYMECAQINVVGGGSVSPPTVSFPGAYHGSDPGITIDIYYPPVTNYTVPGPAVFTCPGSGGSSTSSSSSSTTSTTTSSSTKSTTTSTTSTTSTTTSSTTKSTSSTTTSTTTSSASGATQTKYGQCGGQGYTGPTVCASGSTCKSSSPYYSQCL
ncbi:hypothetical protein SISSUDRAFT_1126182 [Sistotremastrum suecicum HHB10207 ss-3]|uniref:AA9 family lytic polysaccharide monooxygenase n=1 Tax=Sistotremastrum suecicum HHB10207 ss-3 TaxID=1314776 RepID=A0A166GMF0_9AGAM|nr:hypothetical protein SISSUDRAFT_1126182 [Sistotremastrum suecicum HHB10207 ss-3]